MPQPRPETSSFDQTAGDRVDVCLDAVALLTKLVRPIVVVAVITAIEICQLVCEQLKLMFQDPLVIDQGLDPGPAAGT